MKKRIQAALLAEGLLDRQPPSVREKISQIGSFGQVFGLGSYKVRVGGGVRMRQQDLFSAARKVCADRLEVNVRVIGEGEATIRKVEDTFILVIRRGEEVLEASLEVLGLFAEDSFQRLRSFEKAASMVGPTHDLSVLREVARERPLVDEEAGAILDAMVQGASAVQARIENNLGAGKAKLADLVPASLDYFERVCGPYPGNAKPEEYLGSVLPAYRRTLLERDFGKGLEICLLGALRDDLCPAPWIADVDNDRLWEYLNTSKYELDQFSLLATLDLALYRQEDERFRSLSERAVALLTVDEFPRSDGSDCYQLIAVLAKFLLNRIQLMEDGALRQPFWKRMCAWMQATFVARWMHTLVVDVGRLTEMVEQSLLLAGTYANSVDLRREPMVEAGTVSAFSLRREVVGRLVILQARHQAAGRPFPRIDDLRQALERLASVPLCALLPGPLDGHRRPREEGKELADEYKVNLLELSEDSLIGNLSNLSQHFALPEDLRATLRKVITRDELENERKSPEQILARLWQSGAIAAAERDRDLAQAIATAALRVAPRAQEETVLWGLVETLLRSAAAFEEEAAWADWLEAQLFELANHLPAGKMSRLLWHHLQALKEIIGVDLGIFRRAEAVASAGASW